MTIYDEVNDYDHPIKKLTGDLGRFGVSTSENVMYIEFETDLYTNDHGFLAKFYYGKFYRVDQNA